MIRERREILAAVLVLVSENPPTIITCFCRSARHKEALPRALVVPARSFGAISEGEIAFEADRRRDGDAADSGAVLAALGVAA